MIKKTIVSVPVVLSFLSILVYGFYGAMDPSSNKLFSDIYATIYFFLPVVFLLGYLSVGQRTSILILDSDIFLTKYFIWFNFFALIFAFSFIWGLKKSLTGDQLFYSNYGFIHSIKILHLLSELSLDSYNIEAKTILRFVSFVVLTVFVVLYLCLLKINRYSYIGFCIFVSIVLIVFRLLLSGLGGNELIHAPFSGAYLLIFGASFGVSDIVLQAAYFFGFLNFGYFLFYELKKVIFSTFTSILLAIAILTLPGFLFLGTVVEPALWSVICYSVVLIKLQEKEFEKHNLLVLLIVVFSFFRISSIFALLPVFLHLIGCKSFKGNIKEKSKKCIDIFSPVLVFLPFFIFAYFTGSSATSEAEVSIKRVWDIFIDGSMLRMYLNAISPVWLACYALLLVINFRSWFSWMNILFFGFLTIAFFSLNESVWGFTKYRLEVFIPLVVSMIFCSLREWMPVRTASMLIIPLASLLIFTNAKGLYGYPSSCSEKGSLNNANMHYELDFGCNYSVRVPFDFSEVMSHLKSEEALGSTYIPGVYYGTFIHVLNNASLKEYLSAQEIWDRQDMHNMTGNRSRFSADGDFVNKDKSIEYVLLGFTKNINQIGESLKEHGWESIHESADENFGNKIMLFHRGRDKKEP